MNLLSGLHLGHIHVSTPNNTRQQKAVESSWTHTHTHSPKVTVNSFIMSH